MDLKRTGNLIAESRKALGLTQKQLADAVGVTDKAISRWETGRGFPDAAYLQPLAQTLGLSITEIVNGELTQPENAARQADDAVLSMVQYGRKMLRTVATVLLSVAGVMLSVSPLYTLGQSAGCLLVLGVFFLLLAVGLPFFKKGVSVKLTQIFSLVALMISLVLQVLPVSAALVFRGPDYYNRNLYSCFDPMLWGNGSFGPGLSGVLTVALVLMSATLLIWKTNRLRNAMFVCTILAGVFMLVPPVLLGGDYLTAAGLAVILLLFLSAVLQASANGRYARRQQK